MIGLRLRLLVGTALVAGVLVPAPAAQAADSSVTGTVTLDGVAVVGVEVGWYDPTTDAAGETVTDGNGGYSLTVTGGHPYVLYAGIDHKPSPAVQNHGPWEPLSTTTHPSGSVGDFVGVFVGANGTDYLYQGRTTFAGTQTGVAIALTRPGTITIADARLAKHYLTLRTTGAYRGDGLASVRADAAGSATFPALIPGHYTVSDDSPRGSVYAPWHSGVITVDAGAVATAVPVLEKTGSISGRVTNKGTPLAGIRVTSYRKIADGYAYGAVDITDRTGRYTLSHEPAGSYEIVLEEGSDDGGLVNRPIIYLTRHARVAVGAKTRLDLKARKGGSVSGFVTPTVKGSFEVRVVDAHGTLTGGGSFEAKTLSKPTPFTVDAVEPGASTVIITDAQRATYGSVKTTVRPAVDNRVGVRRLTTRSITVRGTVTGVPTGSVGVESAAYGVNYGGTRMHQGRYVLHHVIPIPGTRLVVQSEKYTVRRATALRTRISGVQNLRAGAAKGTVTGSITAGGFPLEIGASIAGRDANDVRGHFSTTTGPFTAKHVVPGRGSIDLFYDSMNTDSAFVVGSPFWLSVPADKLALTVHSGRNTDVGAIALVINR